MIFPFYYNLFSASDDCWPPKHLTCGHAPRPTLCSFLLNTQGLSDLERRELWLSCLPVWWSPPSLPLPVQGGSVVSLQFLISCPGCTKKANIQLNHISSGSGLGTRDPKCHIVSCFSLPAVAAVSFTDYLEFPQAQRKADLVTYRLLSRDEPQLGAELLVSGLCM